MANVCSDTVVLFPKEDTPGNAVSRLKEIGRASCRERV